MKKNLMILLMLACLFTIGKVSATTYQTYKIGDKVSVSGIEFRVIQDSDSTTDYVTVLKSVPLNAADVAASGATVNTHVYGGYDISKGEVAYYSSASCNTETISNCKNSYADSDVKKVVDGYISNNSTLNAATIALTDMEAKGRLLNRDDLRRLDETFRSAATIGDENVIVNTMSNHVLTKSWLYSSDYEYWVDVSSTVADNHRDYISSSGKYALNDDNMVVYVPLSVRPVLNINKNYISKDNSTGGTGGGSYSNDGTSGAALSGDDSTKSTKVGVADTLLQKSLMVSIIGLGLVSVGVGIYLVVLKKKNN